MTAEQFLDLLDERGLLEPSLIATLRRQVAKAPSPILPSAIVSLLVEKGHLTSFQAKKLLEEAGPAQEAPPPKAPPEGQSKPPAAPPATPSPQPPAAEEEGLGLAPIEEDTRRKPGSPDSPETPGSSGSSWLTPAQPGPPPTRSEPSGVVKHPAKTPAPANAPNPAKPSSPRADNRPPETSPPASAVESLPPLGGDSDMGTLEDLLDDPLLSESSLAGSPLLPATPKKKGLLAALGLGRQPAGQARVRRFNSQTLIQVGGVVLVLLVALGLLLYFTLWRTSADEYLALADQDYADGAYAQAIDKYERFARGYPTHPNASYATVRVALGQLRPVVNADDWERSLATAEELLPTIDAEPGLATARDELASLLPQIADGLAKAAQSTTNPVDKERYALLYEQAMRLVNNPVYLPSSVRQQLRPKLQAMEDRIATVTREIQRNEKLAVAVADIQQRTESGDTTAAYEVRDALLATYPGLESHDDLQQATLQITRKLRDLVRPVEPSPSPLTSDHDRRTLAEVAFAPRQGKPAPGLAGHVSFVSAAGCAWGMDATTGQLLWRRRVGDLSDIPPVAVSAAIGADALLVDSARGELVRVAARTGQLQWRLPIAGALLAPRIDGTKAYVATTAGQVLQIDLATGSVERHVALPQPVTAPPGIDPRRGELLLVGEHTNLYALDAATLDCRAVIYLGHLPGNIQIAPLPALGLVAIADNSGVGRGALRIVSTDGETAGEAQAALPLEGHVLSDLVLHNGHVLAITTDGVAALFEVDPANGKQPVRQVAKTRTMSDVDADSPEAAGAISYPLVVGGELFVANRGLTRYNVQLTLGQLTMTLRRARGDLFLAPLELRGNVLLHVRRRAEYPGVWVTAMQADAPAGGTPADEIYWQTHLAAGAAGPPIPSPLLSVSAGGDLFGADAAALQAGVSDTPVVAAADQPGSFAHGTALPDGRVVYQETNLGHDLLLYDPQAASAERLRRVNLQLAEGRLTAPLLPWLGGAVATSDAGQVRLLDPATGRPLASRAGEVLPWQPPLGAGTKIAWHRPAVVGAAGRQLAVYDGARKLYLLGIEANPKPHLAAVGERETPTELAGPLAALEEKIFAVSRAAAGDTLLAFNTPDLAGAGEWPLAGRLVWGPQQVGSNLLLATDEDRLTLVGPEGPQWTARLHYGRPAGPPIMDNGDYTFASLTGMLWRIDGQTGEEQRRVPLDQPLGSGLTVVGNRLAVHTADGALLIVDRLSPP